MSYPGGGGEGPRRSALCSQLQEARGPRRWIWAGRLQIHPHTHLRQKFWRNIPAQISGRNPGHRRAYMLWERGVLTADHEHPPDAPLETTTWHDTAYSAETC